ncbi:HIT domain-containing protein [Candidatus Woesearchaeota archaeon]|nr:HIT domain-containing protein [Candidatus Woesearchaeota archaeon]
MSGISEEEWQKMSPEEREEFQIKNCVFCKIISGEIPSKKIYDDNNFVGILDINPGVKGHILVLPKKHVQIMPQLGTELSGELGIVCKKISEKMKKALSVNDVSVFVANGAVAGQNAPHFMMHIIPRKENDNISLNPELKKFSLEKINDYRKKIIKGLGLPDLTNEKKQDDSKEEKQEVKELETQNVPDKDLLDKISKMFN